MIFDKNIKKRVRFCGNLFFACAVFLVSSNAFCQTNVPPAGESGVIEKSLRSSRPQFKSPEKDVSNIIKNDSRKVEDPGAGPRFFVEKIQVQGNTLFSDQELASLVDLGGAVEVTLGVLTLIANEITAFYVSNGYILSFAYIPPQEIVEGVVLVQIVESGIGKLQVQGNKRFTDAEILSWMGQVKRERVLREQTLERALLELNDIYGLKVKSILKPGDETGTSDLILKIEETKPFKIEFDVDNFGSRFTGRHRFGLTASVGNLGLFGDSFIIRGLKSESDQSYINASYSVPITDYGTRANFSFIYSDFALGDSLSILNAEGTSNLILFDITQKVYRSRRSELYISVGGEIRNFKNSQADNQTSKDNLRDIFFGFGGNWSDRLLGRTFYDIRLQWGFTEGNIADPLNSRFHGRGDVFISSFSFQRFQSIKIFNSYFVFRGKGQIVANRVLSPDQFAIGGFGTVRGFPLAENAGDNGFAFSWEYVLPFPIKIPLSSKPGFKSLNEILSLFGFIDHGQIFVRNKQPGEGKSELTGAGGGIRVNIPKLDWFFPQVSITASYGFPVFTNKDPSDGSSSTFYFAGLISF